MSPKAVKGWSIDYFMDGLIDWWIDDWLIDWWLIDWLIGQLVGWLVGWLIDWLIDWFIDWLIDWLTMLTHVVPNVCIRDRWEAGCRQYTMVCLVMLWLAERQTGTWW